MEDQEKKRVSYSQFKMWQQCPFHWKLVYKDKHKIDEPSIHLIFGTAMHETIQLYLTAMYNNSVKYADELDLMNILRENMAELYVKYQEEFPDLDQYIDRRQMVEFYYDGEKIINWFKTHRVDYFNSRTEELLGVELELKKDVSDGIEFIAYLDIVVRNKETGKIRIIDLKTSTKGWNSYAKNDSKTTAQLVLYKSLYASLHNLDPKDIEVEYIILKRKLYEDIPYPQKQIQKYVPASGKPTMNRVLMQFKEFVSQCFTDEGEYKEGFYPKIATKNNCRFCEFNNKPHLCNKEN